MMLAIRFKTRSGNTVVGAILTLLTCVFGDSEKELGFEEGGMVLTLEDSPENIELFAKVLIERSWGDFQFAPNQSNSYFQMGVSAFGGEERWSQYLNQLFNDSVVSVAVT
jgi:hypothetical protein